MAVAAPKGAGTELGLQAALQGPLKEAVDAASDWGMVGRAADLSA
jgi:hypothetical protein